MQKATLCVLAYQEGFASINSVNIIRVLPMVVGMVRANHDDTDASHLDLFPTLCVMSVVHFVRQSTSM
jgi:hypothetical protein